MNRGSINAGNTLNVNRNNVNIDRGNRTSVGAGDRTNLGPSAGDRVGTGGANRATAQPASRAGGTSAFAGGARPSDTRQYSQRGSQSRNLSSAAQPSGGSRQSTRGTGGSAARPSSFSGTAGRSQSQSFSSRGSASRGGGGASAVVEAAEGAVAVDAAEEGAVAVDAAVDAGDEPGKRIGPIRAFAVGREDSTMKSDRIDSMKALRLPAVLLVILLLPMAAVAQQSFDSPQAALDALRAAMQVQDKEALQRIFGPQLDDLRSGDPVQDAADIEAFARRLKAAAVLEPAGEDQRTLLVGPEGHPFAVPIVRRDGKWTFDTAGGKEELLNRRIGQNELGAVSVCRAYVVAQREYYLDGAAGTGVPEYAQRLMSTPGKRDGLYWQTGPDEPLSPLGPLVARAQAEGYASQKDQPG